MSASKATQKLVIIAVTNNLHPLELGSNTRVDTLLPDMTPERLRGLFSINMPASEAFGAALMPTIGLPRHVTVNGEATPLDAITTGVGVTPTIAFAAPSFGKADVHHVRAVQLDDLKDAAGNVVSARYVLSMATTKTSVAVPTGVLQASLHYNFEVTAVAAPGYDLAKPYVAQARDARARTYTGLVAP